MSLDESMAQLDEECAALSAIYPDDFAYSPDEDRLSAAFTFVLERGPVTMHLYFPPDYPTESPPVYELQTQWPCKGINLPLETGHLDEIHKGLLEIWETQKGQVVVFAWVEWLREYLEAHYAGPIEESHALSQTQAQLDESPGASPTSAEDAEQEFRDWTFYESQKQAGAAIDSTDSRVPAIVHADEPIVDRKSVFIAHAAAVRNEDEVKRVVETLLQDRRIARATHNIMAYRIVTESGIVRQDNDDDGETAAGQRLQHMLQISDCRNVVVVVTRFYGGIQLGPARFKHINNAARMLLEQHGFIPKK
ncbi:ribosomal protein S5 domain 2-type protein [Polychytrium aggregatum]|uniref:ribosomal protein S5 domain 2-type protein n=1 Tax=Polychytrium aggregatum TaxID=110093 RepID=UPI0022FED52B|nr:ribosomal protein S5 domain 2-type protein [Polychytrium aggregatum]KAI9203215.1 ribosomal protein S5 domain 2-type protein [Polychytrium aggregatum]